MRITLDMEKLEKKRIAEGISKRDMADIVEADRPTYYFDLLKHNGKTNKEDRALKLANWYGSMDCIRSWSVRRYRNKISGETQNTINDIIVERKREIMLDEIKKAKANIAKLESMVIEMFKEDSLTGE